MFRPCRLEQVRVEYTDEEIAHKCDAIVHDMECQSVPWMYSNQLPYDDFGNIQIRDFFTFLGRPYPVILRGSRVRMQESNKAKYRITYDILVRYVKRYRLTWLHMDELDDREVICAAQRKLEERYNCCIRDGIGCFVGGKSVNFECLSSKQKESIRDLLVLHKKSEVIEKKIKEYTE